MIALDPPLRFAKAGDAPQLAHLINFAGDGLPLHIWQGLAGDGQDPWDVGRDRQAQKAREGRIVVVDFGEGPVASLTGYRIGAEPVQIDEGFPPLFRPLQELENQAADSWYVNALACYPEHRGKGIGSRLLGVAEEIARAEGLARMSIIVAADNLGARRLYERHGYAEVASVPCVREGWVTDTETWVLMMKPLAASAAERPCRMTVT